MHARGMKAIDDAVELGGPIFGAFELAELEARAVDGRLLGRGRPERTITERQVFARTCAL
ncbi:MAG: hypothetical protein JOY58_10590 [Solirubrobacterales bacterium]|nr:hypothetical protein [Solirubrobacterales bacterium]MBV9048706.1 hypothetical protein [Solirubrobacterales bacterium]